MQTHCRFDQKRESRTTPHTQFCSKGKHPRSPVRRGAFLNGRNRCFLSCSNNLFWLELDWSSSTCVPVGQGSGQSKGIVHTDSRVLNLKGATKISPPSLMEEIKVSNIHPTHPAILSAIKSYRNLSTSFLNLRQLHSMTPLNLLLPLW